MSKKKQKKRMSRLVPSTVDRPVSRATRTSPLPIPSAPVTSKSATRVQQAARPQRQTLVTDYRYVVSDLRRIGIVASVMFAIIVALSFVIK